MVLRTYFLQRATKCLKLHTWHVHHGLRAVPDPRYATISMNTFWVRDLDIPSQGLLQGYAEGFLRLPNSRD